MATYKTPGVYIEEIPKLPPSIAEVETAIPAFIGYTQVTNKDAAGYHPVRITSLLEYETLFGKAVPTPMVVSIRDIMDGATLKSRTADAVVAAGSEPVNTMYYHLQMYFANGGGPCYIVSVGVANGSLNKNDLIGGLNAIANFDEPTLLVFPEGIHLPGGATDEVSDAQDAVSDAQADVDDAQDAIDAVAPATPSQSLLDALADAQAALAAAQAALVAAQAQAVAGELYDVYDLALQQAASLKDRFVIMDCANDDASLLRDGKYGIGINNLKYGAAYHPFLKTSLNYLYDEAGVTVSHLVDNVETDSDTLDNLHDNNNEFYNLARQALGSLYLTLNPSATMAGIYAAVDNARGVWKAPANVGVSMVNGLTKNISGQEQEGLNVDPNAGKSINAIRFFTGKGNLVWGARTLAGNDNEWRYINVRRLFNMVEESTKKATEAFVFEANDANTWVKVQGMIENYLTTLWRAGALQGAKPEHAFYVSVGLGKTMTAQDILEGRMYVEIGMAAVRPAEFIILRFSHKLAES